MSSTLDDADMKAVFESIRSAWDGHTRVYPGESADRQPVHTVYGGAHLFKHDTSVRLSQLALRAFDAYAPDFHTLAKGLDLRGVETIGDPGAITNAFERDAAGLQETDPIGWRLAAIHARVRDKLEREAVEDFRIDFEDGYGHRADDEEDACAEAAAIEVAKGMEAGTLPPFIGIRIKQFSGELHRRGARTLDIFLTTLGERTGGALPGGFVVTLPKIVRTEQITALADLFDLIEGNTPIALGALKMEFMIETTQSIIGPDGSCPLMSFVEAARGRCVGAHFGVYDYTASCSITAEHQRMRHPACDFARDVMQVALSGTGLFLSDGATNIMPVPVHRGDSLSDEQIAENLAGVHRAWRIHFEDVRHSLERAYYQGWDLHPAQLVPRYAALYSFFLEGLDAASARLKNFIEMAARATLVGDVFDDAATGQGLLNFFIRGVGCGAITEEEACATGLTMDELRSRSFLRIIEGRRGSA